MPLSQPVDSLAPTPDLLFICNSTTLFVNRLYSVECQWICNATEGLIVACFTERIWRRLVEYSVGIVGVPACIRTGFSRSPFYRNVATMAADVLRLTIQRENYFSFRFSRMVLAGPDFPVFHQRLNTYYDVYSVPLPSTYGSHGCSGVSGRVRSPCIIVFTFWSF